MRKPVKKKPEIKTARTIAATVKRDLLFGSGKIALKKDQRIQLEVGKEIFWVYDDKQRLLYTFRSRAKLVQYIEGKFK